METHKHKTGKPIIWKEEGERGKNEHKETRPDQAKQVALVPLGSQDFCSFGAKHLSDSHNTEHHLVVLLIQTIPTFMFDFQSN